MALPAPSAKLPINPRYRAANRQGKPLVICDLSCDILIRTQRGEING